MQIFLIVFSVIALDQLTKAAAKRYLLESGTMQVPLLGDWLKFTYTENPGIAFGIQFGGPWVVSIFSLVAMVGICYYLYRSQQNGYARLAMSLILGGAVGNLIDRVLVGRVVDFIHFDLYNGVVFGRYVSLWPIFNVADSAITIGVAVMLIWYREIFEEPSLTPATTVADTPAGNMAPENISGAEPNGK